MMQSERRALCALTLIVLGPIVGAEPVRTGGFVSVAWAQERISPRAHSVVLGRPAPAWTAMELADTGVPPARPTQWKKGLVVGGAIGAVGLGFMVYGQCEGLKETDQSCVGPGFGGAALGAATGGLIGALIGGQFPKRSTPEPAADSTAAP